MTLEEARDRAQAQDRHYQHITKNDDGSRYSYYKSEIGWKVETREITKWEEVI